MQSLRDVRKYSALLKAGLWLDWWRVWRGLPVFNWMLGAHYFREGDYRTASKFYGEGLTKSGKHKARRYAQLDQAYCMFRLSDPNQARTILKEILQSDQRLRDAYLLLAEIELLLGDSETAESVLRNCLFDHPGDLKATLLLAQSIFSSQSKKQFHNEMLEQLFNLRAARDLDDAEMPAIDMVIAQYQLFHGDAAQGEKLLARTLAHESSPVEASLLRAEWLLIQGRTFQAQAQLGRVAERMPLNPKPLALLAKSYLVEGVLQNPEWALTLAQSACSLSYWKNAANLEILARAYELNDDALGALLIVEQLRGQYEATNADEERLAALKAQAARLRSRSKLGSTDEQIC